MLSVAELEILLKARDDASKVLAQAGGNLKGFGATMDRVVRPALLSMAAAAATFIGTAGVMIRTVAESQASQASLDAAVRATGASFDDIRTKQLDAFVQSLEHFSGFSRNEVRDALALLVFETGDVQEAMTREKIAVDFARGAHLDLYTASKLLGKVTDETINVLARYGIHVDKNTTSTELFSLIQKRFADQGATYADTLEGKWSKVQNRFTDVIDDFSKRLIPIISKLLDGAEDAERKIDELLPEIQKWIDKNPDLLAFGSAITGVSVAFAGLAVVAGILASPIVTIGLVAGAIYSVYLNAKLVADNWPKFITALKNGDLNGILKEWIGPLGTAADAWSALGGWLNYAWTQIMNLKEDLSNFNWGNAFRDWINLAGIFTGFRIPGGGGGSGGGGGGSGGGGGGGSGGAGGGGGGNPYQLPDGRYPKGFTPGGVPYYAAGTPYVPETGLAMLHRGEAVIPASQNRGFGSLVLNLNNYGTIVGVDNLREFVLSALREALQGGGFRGVLSGGR